MDRLIEEDGRNQTIVVIAHRLSTIKNADMIAVISGGMVVETGNHAQLISKHGVYYDLVEAQRGKKKEGSVEALMKHCIKDKPDNVALHCLFRKYILISSSVQKKGATPGIIFDPKQ